MRLSPWSIARSPVEIDELFFRQRAVDGFGHRLHVAFAMVGCFLVAFPTSVVEWAFLPVLICTLIRMTAHHRVLRPLWLDPVALGVLAFVVFTVASTAWSGVPMRERASGTTGGAGGWLGDVQALRFAIVLILLWPALDRRRWLVGALAAGFLVGQSAQLAHLIGLRFDIAALDFRRMPGRISGWWDPVVGGSLLCGALGLCLGGALLRSPTLLPRVIGVAGTLSTLACIGLTGSRGAYLAAAATLSAGLIVFARQRSAGTIAAAVAMIAVAGPVGAWAVNRLADDRPRERLIQGAEEVRAALSGSDTGSDTGNRIAMAAWAWRAFRAHPVAGVGAGGLPAWVRSRTDEQCAALGMTPTSRDRVHAHAHNWPLHLLAIGGIIGCGLMALAVTGAISSGLRTVGTAAGHRAGGFEAGPALGLLGLVFAGMFDPISINAQTACLLFVLIALCLPKRPTPLGQGFADGGAP